MPSFMNDMGLTGKTMGYLVAVFAMAQLIASPITGRWVDLYGRKKMIIIGLFIFGVSELLFGLGTDVWMLYAARVLGGISRCVYYAWCYGICCGYYIYTGTSKGDGVFICRY